VAVGPPQVITKLLEGKKCEPYEEAHVEVPQEHMGQVTFFLTWGLCQNLLLSVMGRTAAFGNALAALVHCRQGVRGLGCTAAGWSMNVCCL
jgi:hypothetical protein